MDLSNISNLLPHFQSEAEAAMFFIIIPVLIMFWLGNKLVNDIRRDLIGALLSYSAMRRLIFRTESYVPPEVVEQNLRIQRLWCIHEHEHHDRLRRLCRKLEVARQIKSLMTDKGDEVLFVTAERAVKSGLRMESELRRLAVH